MNTPKVAAAVAEICMVGLATTAHATRGPPKPDKARIDRLAYVVSEFCTCFPSWPLPTSPAIVAEGFKGPRHNGWTVRQRSRIPHP